MLHIHFYELKQRDSLHTKLHALLLHMSPVAVMHFTYFFFEFIKIKTTKWMLYVHTTTIIAFIFYCAMKTFNLFLNHKNQFKHSSCFLNKYFKFYVHKWVLLVFVIK